MDMGIPSRRATEGAHIAAGIPVLPVAGGVRGSLAGHSAARRQAYTPGLRGVVAGYRLAGIEPDGDPLDQVVLKTRLAPAGGNPAVNLIVSSYLENFQPDTTPVLPDLLHPTQSAVNLGGFLQGKALLTDDAGNVLAIGSFLAEAFLDNSNHAVLQLTGSGLRGRLKGSFLLRKDGALNGSLTGSLSLPASARRQIAAHRGATMRSLKKIISVVTVRPQPMMGKAKTGTPNAPLHTGYGAAPTGQTHRSVPIWAIAAGAGAIIAFLLSGVLYWTGRETKPAA